MKKIILVIAAHPDDELLGVGATLAAHVRDGDDVFCVILGEGMNSREGAQSEELAALHANARTAGAIIGFKEMYFCNVPDNAFDTVSLLSITQRVEKYIAEIKPEVIYTHHGGDLNIDHRLTFQAVLTACRPCNEHAPQILYTFETVSSTEWQSKDAQQFKPTSYKNIEATFEIKLRALRCYVSEMREFPHSRSEKGLEVLAQYRGMESGMLLAEAFCLVRQKI